MKKSPIWIMLFSFIIIGLLSELCLAAPQLGEDAKDAGFKSINNGVLEIKPGADVGKIPSIGSQVSIEKVPIAIQRRAANLLEELRYDPWEPSWKNAHLGNSVNLFFRPDINGVAYYEFNVEPSGFIIVSNGEFDVPIPHYSSIGDSIGEQLKSRAKSSGTSAVKFYKLDSLSYVAEDANEELASNIGEMPLKISGMDASLLNAQNSMVILNPIGENDDKLTNTNRSAEKSGPESYPIQFQNWQSWIDLKKGYASNYKLLLDAQRNDAAEEWAIQKQLADLGEGLFPGDEYVLAFLYPGETFEISGPGKDYINYNVINRDGMPNALQIQVINKVPPEGKAEFEFSISYKNGEKEIIKFAVLDPTKMKRQDGEETKPQMIGTITKIPEMQRLRVQVTWEPWVTSWAGSHSDQRIYNQFLEGDCYIGCGPVAWAMLFGWADHQSWIGNPNWNRGGIYREDGGYGDDVDAPRLMDDGVENMIREIHNHVRTFCSGDQGSTYVWNLDEAWRYLDGRSGAGFRSEWGAIGSRSLRNRVRDSIRDRDTPAVIGTGLYEHNPLAYGYRHRESRYGLLHQRQFYINQGWGGYGNGWIDARTWFAGEIFN